MNKVTISISIISFFVIKHRFKNGIILNEVNTSNKRESSQNMIEMLRSNSQDVSLSLYILRQIEDMPILHYCGSLHILITFSGAEAISAFYWEGAIGTIKLAGKLHLVQQWYD